MKKIFTMAIAVIATFVSLTVNAQSRACHDAGTFSVEPHVGVVVSDCSKFDDTKASDCKTGFTAGVEGQYMFNNWLGISAGANYTQEGFKKYGITYKLDYVTVPALMNFYVCKGLALKTGVEIDVKVNDEVSGYGVSMSADYAAKNSGHGDFQANSVVCSVPVGISYEYKDFVADLRFSYGVTNALGDSHYDCKSNAMTFTLGYRF